MKLLLIVGTHPRHRFIIEKVFESFDSVDLIIYQRESLLSFSEPQSDNDHPLIKKHFEKRLLIEEANYGQKTILDLISQLDRTEINIHKTDLANLNSEITLKFLAGKKYDLAIFMGPGIISNTLLETLPANHINIHLGLSPWYRGSGTMFWPTFNWEPWKTGATFHRINKHADSGSILHQVSVGELHEKDGVHDTAAKAVLAAKKELPKLVNWLLANPNEKGLDQPFVGRSFLASQIKLEHLNDVHNLRDDQTIKILRNLGVTKRPFKLYSVIQ